MYEGGFQALLKFCKSNMKLVCNGLHLLSRYDR